MSNVLGVINYLSVPAVTNIDNLITEQEQYTIASSSGRTSVSSLDRVSSIKQSQQTKAMPKASPKSHGSFNPKRRMEGYVVEFEGEKVKVALLNKGDVHYYRFPSKKLTHKNITEKNQPFELSEYEIVLEEETHCLYVFKPLATNLHKRKRPVPLTPERRSKLDFILREDKDAKA